MNGDIDTNGRHKVKRDVGLIVRGVGIVSLNRGGADWKRKNPRDRNHPAQAFHGCTQAEESYLRSGPLSSEKV